MFAFADQIKIKKKKAIGGGSHSTLIQIEKRGVMVMHSRG